MIRKIKNEEKEFLSSIKSYESALKINIQNYSPDKALKKDAYLS